MSTRKDEIIQGPRGMYELTRGTYELEFEIDQSTSVIGSHNACLI